MAAAILAVSALALGGCQTTGGDHPSGAVVGGVTGAAAGLGAQAGIRAASGGHAGNPLIGLLVGAVAGAAVGHLADDTSQWESAEGGSGLPLSREDRAQADAAANKAGELPVGERADWKSLTEEGLHGWAVPHSDIKKYGGRECRYLNWGYARGSAQFSQVSRFCRADGRWVLGSSSGLTAPVAG